MEEEQVCQLDHGLEDQEVEVVETRQLMTLVEPEIRDKALLEEQVFQEILQVSLEVKTKLEAAAAELQP
tara:strand:+ start:138 stop:344 length:207 start_codon:yes stop_codon:yes gene_type:complete